MHIKKCIEEGVDLFHRKVKKLEIEKDFFPKELLKLMEQNSDFYFGLSCKKLGKTIELEPNKNISIDDYDEFIVIGKLKSPVSKVSFCYLKNDSELDIEALGIGGVILVELLRMFFLFLMVNLTEL